MNWDCSLSDSKAQSLDCHARNAKESSPTGSNFLVGGRVNDPMGVEHCITSPVWQKQRTGFRISQALLLTLHKLGILSLCQRKNKPQIREDVVNC